MEIMMSLPVAGADFNFKSTCTSPMGSTPTSQHGGSDNYFFSAPTSPTSAFMFHRQISFAFASPTTQNPIDWEDNILENPEHGEEEENPDINENSEELFTNRNNSEKEENHENHEDSEEWITNSNNSEEDEGDSNIDFAFDFSGQLELTPSLPADELFDGGKIKPLEPQPKPKKILRNALSFRKKKKYSDPCVTAVTELRCYSNYRYGGREHRGRERVYEFDPNSTRRLKGSKSLSPLRNSNTVSDQKSFSPLRNSKMISDPKPVLNDDHNLKQISPTSSSGSGWYGKWKLTNLLFRSASEGHQTNKKYDFSQKTQLKEVRNSSYRSTERSGSGGRKKENVPVHEWHYKANRTASGDLRRKTFLPYKQNLMGCMASDAVVFEPSGKRVISNSQAVMPQY